MPRHRLPRVARAQHLVAMATAGAAAVLLVPAGGLEPTGQTPVSARPAAAADADNDTSTRAAARAATKAAADTNATVTAARAIPTDLGGLRREAVLASRQLTVATKQWEAGRAQLATARARALQARAAARQATAAAKAAQDQLGEIAATSYRRPDAGYALVTDDAGETLRAAGTLDLLGNRQAAKVEMLLGTRERARQLSAKANTLEAAAATKAAALDAQRRVLTVRSVQITAALSTALDRLEAQRRASRRASRAAVPGCTPRPGFASFPNGLIPSDGLCPVGKGHSLRADAALAFLELNDAFAAKFGRPLCLTDSYRSLPEQRSVYVRKPGLAAVPGTSNHGWGLAVDLCNSESNFGTPAYRWLDANGDKFGWDNPAWARPGGSGPREAWHWEYKTAK